MTAWLIERGGPDRLTYWMGFGAEAWTRKPEHAVWFQRQVDAQRVMEGFRFENARVAEHVWWMAAQSEQTEPLECFPASCRCCVCQGKQCFMPHPGHSHDELEDGR
jgi:hypothetical protein